MNEQGTGGNSTSTRCRFCGCDEPTNQLAKLHEYDHFQVVVACGSCGHAFVALSRN
ncbi:MAG: hypothetical protein ACYDGM_11155 [Vulcanimicrobiaceae bacterium]